MACIHLQAAQGKPTAFTGGHTDVDIIPSLAREVTLIILQVEELNLPTNNDPKVTLTTPFMLSMLTIQPSPPKMLLDLA